MSEVKRFPQHTTSPITSELVEILRAGKPGDELLIKDLSQRVGRNVAAGGDGYPNLATARKRTEELSGLVWEPVRGEGRLRCLNDQEIEDTAIRRVRGARRHNKRTAQKASCATAETPVLRAIKIQLQAIELFVQPTTRKKLADTDANYVPDKARLLELFRKD